MLDVPGPQLRVGPASGFAYDLQGRSRQRDREQARAFLGVLAIRLDDEERLRQRLEREVAPKDIDARQLRLPLLGAHRPGGP